MGFQDFCGNVSLWNLDLLLNNTWPQFTECFQQTLLVWVPCGLLWLVCIAYLPYLCTATPQLPGKVTWLHCTKMFLSLALCLVSVISLIKTVSLPDQSDVATSQYVAYGIQIATFLLSGVLTSLERKKGLVTSGVQFLFWLLTLVASIVPLYSSIIQKTYEDDLFLASMLYVQFPCIVLMFLLQFLSEAASRHDYHVIGEEDVSPEVLASFPSRLVFWWFQSLVIRGFKKALVSGDLFTMSPINQSRNIVPRFLQAWRSETSRITRLNSTRPQQKKASHINGYDNDRWKVDGDEKTPLLKHQQSLTSTPTKNENGDLDRGPKGFHGHTAVSYKGTRPDLDGRALKDGLNGALKDPKQGQGDASGHGGGPRKGRGGQLQKGQSALSAEAAADGLEHQSLLRVLAHMFGLPLLAGQVMMLIYTLLQFVNPMVLNALLSYVKGREGKPEWQGYVLACSFFIASFCASFIYHQYMHRIMPLGMRVKSAIISAIYSKALTMSNESRRQSTVGEIVNLMSIDCQRLQDVTTFIHMTWSTPLTLAIALYQLWGTIGPACLAGLGVMVLVIPVNLVVVSKQRKLRIATMLIKDQRLKLMAEVLNGIKVLKLYGWEVAFQEKVLYYRNLELANLRKIAFLNAFSMFVWTLVPFLVTLASFAAYVLTSDLGYLDSTTAFVSLSLFNLMRAPINQIPQLIPTLIQAGVSLRRVNNFLIWADLDPDNVTSDPNTDHVISIEQGTFTWDTSMPRPVLNRINLQVKQGSLVAVVGTVGCGKSSLLAAMLGEMEKLAGKVTTKGSIAYVPQEAWMLNATVRDNILFGKTLSRRRYDQVVRACALQPDFNILVGGDMTEIGEKGINMSGGQKQRVSMARAVYSDADVYLLDDPLSAVDSHVGKHIFQHVIGAQGLLAGKTRVLVTHGIHWLPMVDQIVVLTDGAVSEVGSYDQLLSKDGAFANFIRTYFNENDSDEEEDPEIQQIRQSIFQRLESVTSDACTSGDERKSPGLRRSVSRQRRRAMSESGKVPAKVDTEKEAKSKLIQEEQSKTGSVKLSVYKSYVQALGGLSWLGILLLYVLFQASALAASIWLSDWTDDSVLANTSLAGTDTYNDLNALYLGVYGGLGAAQAVFILSFSMLFNTRMVRASGKMHQGMLRHILKSPMSFFDTTPVGRIINRFSRDVDTMDNNLPMSVRMTIQGAGNLLNTTILISYSSPIFLSVVVPIAAIYKLVQVFYINTSRQLKRLESTTRSPVYTHFTETIQGATSIRAYGACNRFIIESQRRVDHNLVCFYSYLVAQRWLGVRLEMLGSVVTLAAALFAVINTSLSSGLVGLSVTYAMNVTQSLNMLVRVYAELESNIVSTERIKEYSETPTEAEWTNPDVTPDKDWPAEGAVKFKDFELRYRPGLDLVLRGIACDVKGGEKVGIVGRTGAGKSSLTVALFRLVEAAGGSIVIDGHNIHNLGLHDLRTRLTILPQDPVIFSGSLRMNLDPTGSHTDSELWNALDLAHLHAFVSGLPSKLDYECGEGGQNLSVGQRQLMCLARSVLRKSKILVLDEATAAVDMETDEVIQRTIRSEFKDSTVLTIAHRLNTILDYDRIMVMDEGHIKEFAPPQELLSDPNSTFYSMAKAAGLV